MTRNHQKRKGRKQMTKTETDNIQLTETQKLAISKTMYWFKTETNEKQIFTIAGYAGTGKTTIVKALIEELGIQESKVTFVTFTGKAALQLTMKGNVATTIHQLIYNAVDNGNTIEFERKEVEQIKDHYDLIVIDELSMVSKDILEDLLSYGVPIIGIGDHGQLEPIGEDNGLLKNPDVILTEIHRQAKESPIIYLSMLAREGKTLPIGVIGENACVLQASDKVVTTKLFSRADQVLCSYNKTRQKLNHAIRKHRGFTNSLPQVDDKIICTKNNWEEKLDQYPLINGMIGNVKDVDYMETGPHQMFQMDFQPEFTSSSFRKISALTNPFLNEPVTPQQFSSRKFNIFDYGYAITTHKAQGSQWKNVLVYYEPMGKTKEQRQRLLYTAITRAEENLIIVLP